MKSTKSLLVLVVALCSTASSVFALNFSFTGNLGGDNDVQLFTFTAGASSTVTLRTWSYAGGTNAAGATIARGGFDPILALFDSAGSLINQNDDGGSSVAADSVTTAHYDTYLSSVLSAGTYTVSVAQYANFAIGPNLSNGFAGSGTSGWRDATGDYRDSHWAFDILNVEQAQQGVPDHGATLALLGASLLGLVALRRRFAA